MTFEQLDRSIDADSDSDDDLAEQAHLYRCERNPVLSPYPSSLPLTLHAEYPPRHIPSIGLTISKVATERAKGKDPASPTSSSPPPTSGMAGLSIDVAPPKPPRPAAPPRPSAQKPTTNSSFSPPSAPRRRQEEASDDEEDDDEDEDENDPFADRNAVVTPGVERGEPRW